MRKRRTDTQCPLGPDLFNSETGPGTLVVCLLLLQVLCFFGKEMLKFPSETLKHTCFQTDTNPAHTPGASMCDSVLGRMVVR